MPTQSLSDSPRTPGLSFGRFLDRTVTDFFGGRGAWEQRQRMAQKLAAEARAAQEWSRMSLAQKIPIMRREVEIRAEVPEYKSRFGVAIDKELEAARARFTPRDGDGPSNYHKLTQDQKALFNIALNAEHGPQFPGSANVRELKGRDGVSQEAGGRAAYSSPAPTTPGTVALNPKAAEALDRMGHRSSPDLGNAWAGERTSRAPKPKSVELGDR